MRSLVGLTDAQWQQVLECIEAGAVSRDAANDLSAIILSELGSRFERLDRVVGKSFGCCDCDAEFATDEEQTHHARHTGHDIGYGRSYGRTPDSSVCRTDE